MSRYATLTTGLVGSWFVLSLGASALHVYRTSPDQPPLPLGLAALAPILVFAIWFAVSTAFREFVMSLNARVLTLIQSWRMAGFVFLVLGSYGILPKMFAWGAGWGDIAIGATATFAALKLATPAHRGGFLVWQLLGMADLVNAVMLGTLSHVIDPQGVPTSAMTVLPLSLIPSFAVPLFFIFHLICIAQAVRWPSQPIPSVAQPRSSAAV